MLVTHDYHIREHVKEPPQPKAKALMSEASSSGVQVPERRCGVSKGKEETDMIWGWMVMAALLYIFILESLHKFSQRKYGIPIT